MSARPRHTSGNDDDVRRHYADLRATLHRCGGACLLSELPQRYSSCFSVAEYFDLYDHPTRVCCCELEEPRHVLFLQVSGRTADVLNKLIDIEPQSLERASAAVFRTFPSSWAVLCACG